MKKKKIMDEVTELAREAADATLEIYRENFEVEYKKDERNSPLTEADKTSHQIITEGLQEITPEIPVISEESGANMDYEVRKDFNKFWLVDPLDGTREFVKKNDEFTVNIGLIENRRPVAGVVVVPTTDVVYKTDGRKALKIDNNIQEIISVSNVDEPEEAIATRSRSHSGEQVKKLFDRVNFKDSLPCGSSLKFCRLAEGIADVYCRFNPTWEWDTAAAHAVLKKAGGKVTEPDGSSLKYNKQSLKNKNGFLVTNNMLHDSILKQIRSITKKQ